MESSNSNLREKFEQLQKIVVHLLLDFKELYIPAGEKLPYRALIIPLVLLIVLSWMFSVIREPVLVYPAHDNDQIEQNPIITFRITKNMWFKTYEAQLQYGGEDPIEAEITEEEGMVQLIPRTTLRRRTQVKLIISIKKGIGPLSLWQKTFSYTFNTPN